MYFYYYQFRQFWVSLVALYVLTRSGREYSFDMYYKTFIILKQYMENDKHWNKKAM